MMSHEEEVSVIQSLIKDGKVKTKGAYEVMPFDKIGWNKNQSAMVVPMAALYHLLDMGDYEDFIRLHKDKYDFLLRTKVPRSSKLLLVTQDGEEIQLQNICRYYPSKEGGKLIKVMPPLVEGGEWRRLGIDTSWDVKPCNDIKDFSWDLDYRYFVQEAKALIDSVS
jgi:hypothetical protein